MSVSKSVWNFLFFRARSKPFGTILWHPFLAHQLLKTFMAPIHVEDGGGVDSRRKKTQLRDHNHLKKSSMAQKMQTFGLIFTFFEIIIKGFK